MDEAGIKASACAAKFSLPLRLDINRFQSRRQWAHYRNVLVLAYSCCVYGGCALCELLTILERETPVFISPNLCPPNSPDLSPVDSVEDNVQPSPLEKNASCRRYM